MIKINLEVGDPVIKYISDLGEIHGKIYSIKIITGTPFYEIKLTPTTLAEEVLVEGLLGYNRKHGCDFWSLRILEDGSIISRGNHRGMFRIDTGD